ncbi:hypothetical protein KEM54_006969 [Ascosphaera aggregata]|nr:hypothetical protein KEM54_006969 [Ascosphaera aggregata]
MTQSLVCVWYQGRFQVLQHSQWNGAPAGQGLRILEILKRPGAIRAIKAGLEASMPINGKNLSLYSSDWCPSGADILELIQAATPVQMLPLYLDNDFVNNTVYCEHAYAIDLDERGSFEIYIGQEPKHQATESRFKQFGSLNDTIPKFLTSFPLDDLPETPKDFLNKIIVTGLTRNNITVTDT